jgi:hypothetical protein
MSNNFRPVYERPIYKIITEVRNLSLDRAIPQFAAAIDAQIDCDDASDDFIKEKTAFKHPLLKWYLVHRDGAHPSPPAMNRRNGDERGEDCMSTVDVLPNRCGYGPTQSPYIAIAMGRSRLRGAC